MIDPTQIPPTPPGRRRKPVPTEAKVIAAGVAVMAIVIAGLWVIVAHGQADVDRHHLELVDRCEQLGGTPIVYWRGDDIRLDECVLD